MSTPVYTVNGQPVSSTPCGQIIEFDVPGYPQAWIIVAQNGRITFDGPMDLPMPPYQLRCPADVGSFQVAAYSIVNGARGPVIGQTQINVTAATGGTPTTQTPGLPFVPAPTGTPPPMGQPHYVPPILIETGGPGTTFQEEPEPVESGFFGLDLTTVALLALGALVVLPPLLSRRKG